MYNIDPWDAPNSLSWMLIKIGWDSFKIMRPEAHLNFLIWPTDGAEYKKWRYLYGDLVYKIYKKG